MAVAQHRTAVGAPSPVRVGGVERAVRGGLPQAMKVGGSTRKIAPGAPGVTLGGAQGRPAGKR